MTAASEPRAVAVHAKLDGAKAALAALNAEVAELALAAAESRPGAAGKLTAHRAKVDVAERQVEELLSALNLARKIDAQKEVAEAIRIRAENFAVFKRYMTAREKAMATVMQAAATMAAAYGAYSEATLAAQIAVPAGTTIPVMMTGPDGIYGPAFGPSERLILAECWRLGPQRADGIGRFVLPFSKPTVEMMRLDSAAIPPGIDELRAANQAIVLDIEKQIDRLNAAAQAAADRKEAA